MLQEPIYLVRLRDALCRSKALSWAPAPYKKKISKSKVANQTADKLFTITYPELKVIIGHPRVSNKHQLVKRSMLNAASKQLLSFAVSDLGHVIYLFSDDKIDKFWFIPQKYLNNAIMRKAINRVNVGITSFTPISTLSIYISKLQLVVDVIDGVTTSDRGLVGAPQ